ncbi:MAG TPA: sodium:solute symporter [Ignavibacteria bacterium]|nr:sodium:solute symporter [Ignavibacteria bacterium]HRB01554.1 sodium:solute symporter [Ignavibacteria bacterium]
MINFSPVDYTIIIVYLIAVAIFGIITSGKQTSVKDYFLGSRNIPWWAACFSVVATETSTLTFISIPGLAYISNMNFLQLSIGFLIGRIIVAMVFIPRYYSGNMETAYEFLGNRFGEPMRKYASVTFILLRIFADGVRLFTTAIPIKFITGLGYFECILIVGVITLIYSYIGGIKAVIWTDVIQMFVYTFGAVASMVIIYNLLPNGWDDVTAFANPGDKFQIFNLKMSDSFSSFFTGGYGLIGGLVGGAFLAMASHGTDQMIVQRLLTCKDKRSSQKAVIVSGIIVTVQFTIFLVVGLMLYALYEGVDFKSLVINGQNLTKSDEIFPMFIVQSLPVGLAGIVVAGLLSASMSTLSSTFNSLASTTILDLFKGKKFIKDEKDELKYSKLATIFWAIVIMGTGLLFQSETNPAVDFALKIQSLIYGGLLGVFLLGIMSVKAQLKDAVISYTFAIVILSLLFILPKFGVMPAINLTWFTLFGVVITFVIANITMLFRKRI